MGRGEPDASARISARIAKHHALYGYGGAQFICQRIQAAVFNRLVRHPGSEHGMDGMHRLQKILHVLARHSAPGMP